jgi:hypothetical protein
LFEWLVKNKSSIIQQKKSVVKHADGVPYHGMRSGGQTKGKPVEGDPIRAELAINTTNLFDSHMDVHMPGLWNQSMKQGGYTILNQEHKHSFQDIIAEGEAVKVSVKDATWKELGFDFKGKTQVLTYDATISPDDNAFMYKRYLQNKVRNHSVEMFYVKMAMAINDHDYKEEFAEWEKVLPLIANKEDAEANGYFFSIYEAKHVGGAAVPQGSNWATPTMNIEQAKATQQPEQAKATQQGNNLLFLI